MAAALVESSARRDAPSCVRPVAIRASKINPAVIEAMAEMGIDLGEAFPKSLTDEVVVDRRRRDHDGLRRRLPVYPGEAIRGLGARRSGRAGGRDVRRFVTRSPARVRKLVGELVD